MACKSEIIRVEVKQSAARDPPTRPDVGDGNAPASDGWYTRNERYTLPPRRKARHCAPVEPTIYDQAMRAVIIAIGACILIGGISLVVRQALAVEQDSYGTSPEVSVLWYALGGPTPDRLTWLGADGLLVSFLDLPLDLVLITVGTCIALIGLAQRARH
jgi:hypothetical protein